MKLHLHIGPGNHEQILLSELSKRKIAFESSHHFPEFSYQKSGEIITSNTYKILKKIIWGIGSRLKIRKNRLIDFTYPIYDRVTAKHLDSATLCFGWAQVSKYCFMKNSIDGINVLDYPIPHPTTWQHLLKEEELLIQHKPHSLFSKTMHNRMLEEIALADYISVPSKFVLDSFLKNNVSKDKILFNPYGISADSFKPLPKKNEKLRVVFVGSIELRKGVQYLLKSFEALPSEKFELHLIGTQQPDFEYAFTNHQPLDNIIFHGSMHRTELAPFLSGCDVMVMPSILEGLSLTILESMACGVPVISTTNAGGLGVISDNEDGFIINIRSPQEITDKLMWCEQHKEELQQMGTKARKKVLDTYTEKAYVDRFESNVLSLLS